jgi:hypothetical protein
MARQPTSAKSVTDESFRQINVKVPWATGETLDRLKGACNVPLVDLVKMSVDLFDLAHAAEQQGGRLQIVAADGTVTHQIELPHMDIRAVPTKPWRVGEAEREEPTQP